MGGVTPRAIAFGAWRSALYRLVVVRHRKSLVRRLITSTLIASVLVVVPAGAQGAISTAIGTGERTCTLTPGADCRGVAHRWTVKHHGDLRGINLRNADLRGANLHYAMWSNTICPNGTTSNTGC